MPSKDMRQLLKRVRKLNPGVAQTTSRGGHITLYSKASGNTIFTAAKTPSEYRGLKNTISQMRKAGLRVD